jgi:hypothetical protein
MAPERPNWPWRDAMLLGLLSLVVVLLGAWWALSRP